jgi:hypothetical protein
MDGTGENAGKEGGEPIPEILHSFYEERPFLTCTRCGESLADFEEGFRISKNFKRGEVLFEYALCMPCLLRMLEESSEESKANLARFHEERLREVSGFEDCAFCEKTRAEARDEEFGLAGMCHGGRLLESAMVCADCMEDMHAVLSEETKDVWRRFREENFPGVPADFEPFPGEALKKAYG